VNELDVGLVVEVGVEADLLADALPGLAVDFEVGVVDEDDEVGVAGGDFDTGNLHTAGDSDRALFELRNTHARSDLNRELVGGESRCRRRVPW
jgi:hypothetical protein